MKILMAISFGLAFICTGPSLVHGQPRCVQYSLNYIVRDERGRVMDAKQDGLQIATGWEAHDGDLVSLYDAPRTVRDAVGKLNVLSHIERYGICHFREPIKLELTFHNKKMILIHAEGKANILVDSLPFQEGTFEHQLSEREPNTYFYSSRRWKKTSSL